MDEPTNGAQPDATANPEAEPVTLDEATKATLQQAGIDPDDLGLYLSSKKGWDDQHNRRLMEAGQIKEGMKEGLTDLGAMLKESLATTAPAAPASPDPASTLPISPSQFAQVYGLSAYDPNSGQFPDDWNTEVTYAHLFDFGNRAIQMGQTAYGGIEGTLGEMKDELAATKETATTTQGLLRGIMEDGTMAEIADEFPHARQEDVKAAIENAPLESTKDFQAHVRRAAKASHETVQGKIDQATIEERKRHVKEPAYTGMGGGGGATTGESSKHPAWSKEWIDEQERLGNL